MSRGMAPAADRVAERLAIGFDLGWRDPDVAGEGGLEGVARQECRRLVDCPRSLHRNTKDALVAPKRELKEPRAATSSLRDIGSFGQIGAEVFSRRSVTPAFAHKVVLIVSCDE